MSTEAIETVPADTSARSVVVEGFVPDDLHAPFMLRLGSMLIDYMLIMILPVLGLFSVHTFGDLGIVTDRTIWFFSFLLFLFNIIVLPALSGRSVGKALTGLRIVNMDGTLPRHRTILYRQTVGLLLSAITLGLGFFYSIINRRGRSFHDYLAGTIVVSGRRRIV